MDSSSTTFQFESKSDMFLYRKLSNIKEFRRNMKDPLALLLHLSTDIWNMRLMRFMWIYVALQYSFGLGLTIYHLLSTFDKRTLLKYGSFAGIETFILICLWTMLLKYKDIMGFINTFKSIILPINEELFGKEKYKSLMSIDLLTKIIAIVNYVFAISAALGFFLSADYYNSKCYLAVWIEENFSNYSKYILFCLLMSNFPVAVMLSSTSITTMYCVLRSVHQIIIINNAIEGICDSCIDPTERYQSELYQKVVLQKLKMCIMMHQTCSRMAVFAAEILYAPIISYSTGAVILGGSLMVEFYTNDPIEGSNVYFAIVCFSLSGLVTAALYVTSGQYLKDQSEKSYALLTNLPWYYMNEKNKQIYLIFLKRVVIPLSLTNNLLEVNFILLVRIVKAIYSIATLLSQFVGANSSGNKQ